VPAIHLHSTGETAGERIHQSQEVVMGLVGAGRANAGRRFQTGRGRKDCIA
jgi:hypothetical protein